MQDNSFRGLGAATGGAGHDDIPEFVPSIDMHDVFRQLIAEEVRAGRLTRSRRSRIVRYAAQLGLSAVEAGRLIESCRDEVLWSSDPVEPRQKLRLAEPAPARVPTPLKIAMVVAAAIVFDALVLNLLW